MNTDCDCELHSEPERPWLPKSGMVATFEPNLSTPEKLAFGLVEYGDNGRVLDAKMIEVDVK